MIRNNFICNECPPPSMVYVRELSGLSELADIAQDTQRLPLESKRYLSSVTGSQDFTGTQSLREAETLVREGWPEGQRQLITNLGELSVDNLRTDRVLPTLEYDVSGEDVDVGRFLSGEPESMITFDLPPSKQGNVLELIVNCSSSGEVEAEAISKRGAAIVAAVQALEANGYSVGITAATAGTGALAHHYGHRLEYYVPLVSPGGYFDIDAVMFGLVHPSFFRRLMFAAMETEPKDLQEIMGVGGRGKMTYTMLTTLDHVPPKSGSTRVVIERDEGGDGGIAAAQAIINKIVAKHNSD